ncbi:MAG: hypothetical protein WB974_18630, partial [Acidobacteriaceae bacterium]
GEGGGRIVAEGPPEEIARVANSYTGQFLRPYYTGAATNGKAAPRASNGRKAAAKSQKNGKGTETIQ